MNVAILVFQNFVLFLCSFFGFLKVINAKSLTRKKTSVLVLICLFVSILNHILTRQAGPFFALLITYFISSFLMAKLTKNRLDVSCTAMMLSVGISFVVFMVTSVLLFPLLAQVLQLGYDHPVTVVTVMLFTAVIIFGFFKIRRFQNGFPFIHNKKISGLGIFISGLILSIYILGASYRGDLFILYAFLSAALCAVGIFIWVRKGIWVVYKENVKDLRILQLEEQLQLQNAKLQNYKHNADVIRTANHKINERLTALEFALCNMDAAAQAELPDRIQTLKAEYQSSITTNLVHEKNLPTTNIGAIDSLLKYLLYEASTSNIDLDLAVNDSIRYMTDTIIPQDRLETLIGDHVKNARIAINAGSCKKRKIFVELGLLDDCYGLCVHDTGIAFEADTLALLGKKNTTTHADTGGSGIGFMTTFETLHNAKASLVIEENNPETAGYFTKRIAIRFDGKSQNIIRTSYRYDMLKTVLTDSRFTVQNSADDAACDQNAIGLHP